MPIILGTRESEKQGVYIKLKANQVYIVNFRPAKVIQ